MNTIGMNNSSMAMDGQNVYNNAVPVQKVQKPSVQDTKSPLPETAEEVVTNMESHKANLEASAQELQRLSDLVGGRKLQFNVNNETNKVIVRVVNPETNEVVREIPTEEARNIAEMIAKQRGIIFDEII